MSVSETLLLPNQPSSGLVVNTPLGGDGMVAPQYKVSVDVTLAGDGSGGSIASTWVIDKRYSAILNYLFLSCTGPTGDIDAFVSCTTRDGLAFGENVTCVYGTGSSAARARYLWRPPSVFLVSGADRNANEPFINYSIANDASFSLRATGELLLFSVEAARRVPYNVLVNNKPF